MSYKRKSDGYIPPAKKNRTDRILTNGESNRAQKENVLPPLPPISPEYDEIVFTHQSAVESKNNINDMMSYERLEFLGDAYLEVMASRLIWERFKTLPAGRMSQIRELLVKNETLAQYAVMYGFDKRLKLNKGLTVERQDVTKKIRGDVFEAYVAAIILSEPIKGFEFAEDWLTELWLPKLKDVDVRQTNLGAKDELARKILANGVKINYVNERPPVLERRLGMQTYFIGVYLTGWGWENQHLGSGKGLNKVIAGNEAALRALENRPLIDQIGAEKKAFFEKKNAEDQEKSQDALNV